jgi:hypothetical protein
MFTAENYNRGLGRGNFNYHEPYCEQCCCCVCCSVCFEGLFNNMRVAFKGVQTAPETGQTLALKKFPDLEGGPAQYISQFASMQQDRSFDFKIFTDMKALYDSLSLSTAVRAPLVDAAMDPKAPSGNDLNGGPKQNDIAIDAFAVDGALLPDQWPPSEPQQPLIVPWNANH